MCTFQKKKGICWKMGLIQMKKELDQLETVQLSASQLLASLNHSLSQARPPTQIVIKLSKFCNLSLSLMGHNRFSATIAKKKQKVGTRLPHLLGFSAKPRDNYMLLPHHHCLGRFCGHTPYLCPRLAGHTKFWAVILKEDHYYCISHELHFLRN